MEVEERGCSRRSGSVGFKRVRAVYAHFSPDAGTELLYLSPAIPCGWMNDDPRHVIGFRSAFLLLEGDMGG